MMFVVVPSVPVLNYLNVIIIVFITYVLNARRVPISLNNLNLTFLKTVIQ